MLKKLIILILLAVSLIPIFIAPCYGWELDKIGSYLSGLGTFGLFAIAILFAPNEIAKFIENIRFNKKASIIGEIYEHMLDYENGLKKFINPLNDTNVKTSEEIFEVRLTRLNDIVFNLEKDLRLSKVYLNKEVTSFIEEALKIQKQLMVKTAIYTLGANQLGKEKKLSLYNELMDIEGLRTNQVQHINIKLAEINSKYWSNF